MKKVSLNSNNGKIFLRRRKLKNKTGVKAGGNK